MLLLLVITLFGATSLANARISVMYAHEKMTDMFATECLNEMYPRPKKIDLQESDEPCIIFCVLKKFGVINANGVINVDMFRRVQGLHTLDQHQQLSMTDYGSTCLETAEAAPHKQDVCRKAKIFNDCTHLFRIIL